MMMGRRALCMPVGAALAGLCICTLLLHGASAQSDCNTALLTLQPCYPYIEPGNITNPSADCCSPLTTLLTANATCLCQLPPIAQLAGITINQTRALEVATLCNQTVPTSVTSCLSSIAQSPSAPPTAGGTPGGPSGTSPSDKNHGSVLSPPLLLFVALAVHLAMST